MILLLQNTIFSNRVYLVTYYFIAVSAQRQSSQTLSNLLVDVDFWTKIYTDNNDIACLNKVYGKLANKYFYAKFRV